MSARQTGHPDSMSATRLAQASQKRACPHGTSAKPARGATRHTSQKSESSEVDAEPAEATVAGADAAEVVAAGTGA